MKNKKNKPISLEEKYNITVVTEENKHLHPELKDVLEALEKNKGKILFPKQYFTAQRSAILGETKKLYEKSPDLPLKQVLFQIMEPLPDFLPADNLVEVTKIITSTWEELRQKVAA